MPRLFGVAFVKKNSLLFEFLARDAKFYVLTFINYICNICHGLAAIILSVSWNASVILRESENSFKVSLTPRGT